MGSPASPGLPGAAVNELLEFEDGTLGLALNLDEDTIGAVVLGEVDSLEEEQTVKATGRIQTVPVGDALLGPGGQRAGRAASTARVPSTRTETRRMEVQAPGIVGRQPVTEPLQTGIKAIDAMTPIGRGQRELIIGDRKTGKTTVAVDTIINQAGQGVKCIYVAIGQKNSSVAQTVATLEEHQALDYTVVVVASAGDPAPYKYLAPYAGCAMGQHWMENGEHALIIYDDLSKQAEAYRSVSLLLRRPPGREAYPGDVFYLHSRLLERAAKLSDAAAGKQTTAGPAGATVRWRERRRSWPFRLPGCLRRQICGGSSPSPTWRRWRRPDARIPSGRAPCTEPSMRPVTGARNGRTTSPHGTRCSSTGSREPQRTNCWTGSSPARRSPDRNSSSCARGSPSAAVTFPRPLRSSPNA